MDSQSESDRKIKKITRLINILVILNICPIYAGNGHSSRVNKDFNVGF